MFYIISGIPSLLPPKQREDLEFSVGSKATVWEVKDPLLAGEADRLDYGEDTASAYHGPGSLVGGVSGGQLYQSAGGRGYPPPGERY